MKQNKCCLIVILCALSLVRCGVKGDPLAPETPAPIGRGRPTFKRAFEDIKVEAAGPSVPVQRNSDVKKRNDEDENEDSENEN